MEFARDRPMNGGHHGDDGGPGSRLVRAPSSAAADTVGRFARFDRVAAVISLIGVIAANAVAIRSSLLWIVPPALLALVGALSLAVRHADAGRPIPAVGWIAVGNWVAALVVPIALPFLWPILVIVVVIPLVLAAPYVPLRPLVLLIAGAAAIGAAVALIGLGNDDGGAIVDIDDNVELGLVVGGLAALMAPIALIAWQTNRSQRLALDAALRLNSELERSEAQLRESRRRVVEASDEARSRLERDLHDGAQQRLVALGMRARLLASQIDDGPRQELADRLVDDVDQAVDELRELAHGIYPPVLAAHGLGQALAAVARRGPAGTAIDDGLGGRRLEPSAEAALYFTALEALTNAAKHAAGSEVRVTLADHGDRVELRIVDDGPGFDADGPTSHGLANMRDRIETLDGDFTIDSARGAGTRVMATLPTGRSAADSTIDEHPEDRPGAGRMGR